MRAAIAAVLLFILGGCSTQPQQLTREEFLKVARRDYPGITPEQLYAAAEKLFRLSDGDDYSFTYTQATMTAQRRWSFYFVLAAGFGTDLWKLSATDKEGGAEASVDVSSTASQALGVTTVGGYGGTALYDLFWSRMDYLLGVSNHWMTCDESAQRIKTGAVWGSNAPLCDSLTVADNPPEELAGVIKKKRPSSPSPNP